MQTHSVGQNEDLVAASTLYAELSDAAATPSADYDALEKIRLIINLGSDFEASAAAAVRQLIAKALIGK